MPSGRESGALWFEKQELRSIKPVQNLRLKYRNKTMATPKPPRKGGLKVWQYPNCALLSAAPWVPWVSFQFLLKSSSNGAAGL
jgi:hypothetical protein